jgi:hypothetical protein
MIDNVEPVESPRDPARQPERTRFAWRRTVLTFAVVTLLLLRMALIEDAMSMRAVIGAAVGLLGLVLVIYMGSRRIAAMTAPEPVAIGRTLTIVAAAALGYAILGIVLVLG